MASKTLQQRLDRRRPLAERFEEKVDRSGGPLACHPWTAGKGPRGQYGRIYVPDVRRSVSAHRVAYLLAFGSIPAGLFVCHHCDNTLCVNPAHLFVGTAGDNARDRDRKGRHRSGRVYGEDHPDSKLTEEEAKRAIALRGVMSGLDIAELLGVSSSTVSDIQLGVTWKHLKRPLTGA